jgi:hypothetical protein
MTNDFGGNPVKIVRSRRALVAFLLALTVPFALVACGDDNGGDDNEAAQEGSTPEVTESPEETPEEGEAQLLHVVAHEYKFVGIPDTLEAGTYAVHLQNDGKEPHELAIAQLLTDTPIDELLKLPQKEVMKEIKPVGGTFAKPGEASEQPLEAEFVAGDYVAVCFVTNKKGPHAFQGMVHEFTVE